MSRTNRKQSIIEYVVANPGCLRSEAGRYESVQRCIDDGYLRQELSYPTGPMGKYVCLLYPTDYAVRSVQYRPELKKERGMKIVEIEERAERNRQAVLQYVRRHPGCTKHQAGPKHVVASCIARGLIRVEQRPGSALSYALYVSEP